MPGLKIMEALEQMPEMINPNTGLLQEKDLDLSVSQKQNFNAEHIEHIKYDKGLFYDNAKKLEDEGIALGSNPEAINEVLQERQSGLTATKNALLKFVGKTTITVGDTLIGSILSIPIAIVNGDFTKFYDNDVRRFFDKGSEYLDNVMPIYESKSQSEENFWGKLNNAKFWGDGVLGAMSFTVGAVLSELALTTLSASTFGATSEIQILETASLISKAKKIFSLFRKNATSAELKALSKDVTKSLVVGAGYEAGIEARHFLDTARENYIEQYKQQYGIEPSEQVLAEADKEIKKTANTIFAANTALLSVGNAIQFKNIFGKGLSTDLKLFGKNVINKEAKNLTKDYALRGGLEAGYESASKLRKILYTTPKLLKNPLTEMNEEALQGEFNAIGQDYIKKKFNAISYNDNFDLIKSFSDNFKDTYGSEDAGIGFIIGAMGIPGMGIVTGKTKNVKGFGNKLIASFEGGIAEVFQEQNAQKEAIKTAINQASKVNIDNVQEQIKNNSAILTSNKLRDEALENGNFFSAKNHESDAIFSFIKTRDNVGLLNESKEQYSEMIKNMDNADFAKQFGYDKLNANERALTDAEITERKNKVIEQFNKKVNNFQETKELASKVAPVRNFNDKEARLFNEAIHHLMYTTNDLDAREDNLVEIINNKLSKSKNNNEKLKDLLNFHNTWINITENNLHKEIEDYEKNLEILKESSVNDILTEDNLNSKKIKAENKIKELKDTIVTKLNEINKLKDKLSNLGFKIDNNFENIDNFIQSYNEFKNLQKNIENHLNENIFDEDTIKESIIDLAKIQNKRHELISTYNHLNTKKGQEQFSKELEITKRQFKIQYLKSKAQEFLHNQDVELDKDTIKEIEKNVDLQIDENDDEITKEIKSQILQLIDNSNDTSDITELKQIIEDLKAFKEFNITSELIKVVNNYIEEINNKIKSLQKENQEKINSQKELQKKPIFESPKRLLKLFNFNPEQKEHFYNIVKEIQQSNLSPYQKEEELKKRISFRLIPHENPNTPKEAKQKDIDNNKNNNDTVTQVNGIRTEGVSPFNFEMLIDGKSVGGFMMPNQIFIKDFKNNWSQINFEKLEDDSYLQKLLPKLFPDSLISTKEDRLELGKYLKEHNNLSEKLSKIFAENITKTNYTFEELDEKLDGILSNNNFTSQISMTIDKSSISRNIDDILDNADDLITKAATVEINGQKLILFGKSTATGRGFSKKYFVKIINNKLERDSNNKVIWNEVEGSELQSDITDFLSSKDKTEFIDTSNSLFSLLVFEPKGYIRTIFTTNELISKIENNDNDIVIKFNKNRKNLQPITDKITDYIKQFFIENKDKKKEEIKETFINDYFITVKNANNSKVEITPVIQDGELTFRVKDNNKKVLFVKTYVYFNGTNIIKLKIKDNEEAKQINKDYREGKITLSERFEKLKPFSHPVNDLNEVIGELFLDGQKLKSEEFKDDIKNYNNILTAVRKATGTNESIITGFYKDIVISKTNQQDIENLQIKQDLNYFLYLRPGESSFVNIENFTKKVENRISEENSKKAIEELTAKLNQNNTKILEQQEEADTITKVVQPIQTTQDAVPKGLESIFGYNENILDNYSDEELINAYTKANNNNPPRNPSNVRNWLKENTSTNLYKRTISNLQELNIKSQTTNVTQSDIETKKAEIERRRQDIISRKSTAKEKFEFLENIPDGTIFRNDDGDALIVRKKITKRGTESYELVPLFLNEDNVWEENFGGLTITEKKSNGEYNINASLPQIFTSNVKIILPTDTEYVTELNELEQTTSTTKTEIEAKKADTERRRQEDLKKFGTSKKQTPKNNIKVLGTDEYVSRELMELAYFNDSGNNPEIGGGGQSLDRIIERGGYSKEELLQLLKPEIDKINAKYDAEYVEAVKNGEMTKEQAMQALEEVGRKNSAAYAELAALEQSNNNQSDTNTEIEKLKQEWEKELNKIKERLEKHLKEAESEPDSAPKVKIKKADGTIDTNSVRQNAIAAANALYEYSINRINAEYTAKIAALGEKETPKSVDKKADIEIGKVGNTEYEVKVDGVYYQGKKLDNPENKTHRQLIEDDIERKKEELGLQRVLNIYPPDQSGGYRIKIKGDKYETLVQFTGKKWDIFPKQKNGDFQASDPETGDALLISKEQSRKLVEKYLPKKLVDLIEQAGSIKGVDNQIKFEQGEIKEYVDLFRKEWLQERIPIEEELLEFYQSDKFDREKEAKERIIKAQQEVIAKYDAELKALGQTTFKNQSVENKKQIDILKELNLSLREISDATKIVQNIKAFENLYNFLKKKHNFELSLEDFKNLVLGVKSNEGVNKLLKLSDNDIIEYNEAVKNLMQILPVKTKDNPNGIIEITDVLDVLKNLKTKGEVAGRFITKMKTIYLATEKGKSIKGVEYHEAFHAIFRMFLTDSQITKYLKSAESKYGSPTLEQLKELKNSSSDLINLSQQELKNLWLEEKMADDFMNFMKVRPVKISESWLQRLFHKLRNLILSIFNNKKIENDITRLFENIYNGKFKNAKERFSLLRNGVKNSDVNKLLKKSQVFETSSGGIIEKESYFTHSLSETIINTITNEIAKKEIKTITNDEIDAVTEKLRERFNPYNDYNQTLLNSISDDNLRASTLIQMSDLYFNLEYDKEIAEINKEVNIISNVELIRAEVLERLPLYNISKEKTTIQEQSDDNVNELEYIEDEESDSGIVNKKTNEINYAWEKASKRVKQYISSTSMNVDLFNIGEPFVKFIEEQTTSGNTELVKNYEFAIRGNYLYSNLIKMLVNTPSYKMIGMVYSMANTSPEMKYFVQNWFKDIYKDLQRKIDIPLTNTDNLDELYDTLKKVSYSLLNNNSEHFTFMTSDLEKNRIFLWDIIFDEKGITKFLNANNREVSKQVFNKWAKNWESRRVNNLVAFEKVISDYENIYFDGERNILDNYVKILKSDISSEDKAKQIEQHLNKFNEEFSKLGIELPSAFIKYSLINHVISIKQQHLLTEKQLEWFNNFSASGINPITKETIENITVALKNAKIHETFTIFNDLDKNNKKLDELGVVGRLKDIAESVGMFDPTVIPSSFNNQEGKRIYDIVPPSDISRRLNILKDTTNVSILIDYIKTKNAKVFKDLVLNNDINNTYYFYSFFTSESQVDNFLQIIDNNPLLQSQDENYLNNIFSTLNMSYIGGIRQEEFSVSKKDNNEDMDISAKGYGLFSNSDGKSYSNADMTAKILYQLTLLSDNPLNQFNIKEINGQKFAYYKFTQPESKSTVPLVLLPFDELVNSSGFTEKAKQMMFSIFKQEYDRIGKVQKEIDEFINGNKKSNYSESYHYVNQEFGIEGTNNNRTLKIFKSSDNKYYYLEPKKGNIAIELKPEEFWYNEKQEDGTFKRKDINKSKLNPRGIKFFNLANDKADLNSFIEQARKSEILTNNEDNIIKAKLEKFFNYQFEDFITMLKQTNIGLIKVNDENKEIANLLPIGFIKETSEEKEIDRTKLMNAFLNDYLMSYSINSIMYGDNANVAKDSIDWVKRAGGIIGSGNNYGSGESNIILIKSEVKDDIDVTDAQTFSNPFWHLVTILKNKGANDEKIRNIYKKIDSGLETPTTEEYQYLYDNQAQHQPNKTQGYGFEHYLKTSIAPLLRGEVSRLKKYSPEKRDIALELHNRLFNFKLQNHELLFNPKFKDNEQVQNYFILLEEFHNMFEAIPGQEYRHNLLNISEKNNALLVYDSAWKRNKTNVHDIDKNGNPYLYQIENENGSINNIVEPIRIANATMVDQQKTDGVKSTTIDGTQKQRLILTEQDEKIITKFKDKEVTIKTVLSTMEKLQSLRIKRGFDKLKKEIIDEDGNATWETLLVSFIESIQSSSSDPQLLELFQIENGKPKYNLNNPAIETKFQAMFLSFVSSNTLKQKTAGSKFTLMSEVGFNLMRELDDKGNIIRTLTNNETKKIPYFYTSKFISHRLRHDVEVKNETGKTIEYYSEIVVSERFLKKFGFTRKQFYKNQIPQEFLYLQGIRIPTEDKHSMINAKIVDILPDSYGNVIMMPYEIVNLSGADFDIDSLYAKVYQTYTNVLNKKTELYGSYLSKPTIEEASTQAYSEYLAESFEDRKVFNTFNDLKINNDELKKLNQDKIAANQEVISIKDSINIHTKKYFIDNLINIKQKIKSLELAILEQAFNINGLIFNEKEWISKNKDIIENNYNNYNSKEGNIENINPITKGELNNHMLELERKLTNNYGNNKIANTPTSLKIFKKLVEILEKDGLIEKNLGYGVHDMLSKIKADMAISTGAANIGPAALFNNLFGLLIKYKVTTTNPLMASQAFELLSLDKNNQIITEETDKQRIQDTLASVLAAMTDNAKEQLADIFNLTINSLPVALTMIATGNNFDNVMLLMKNPIVKRITELSSEYNKTIQSVEDYKNSRKEKSTIKEKIIKEFGLTDEMFTGDLTYNDLLNALKIQPIVNLWEENKLDIQTKYPEITEEMFNTLSEQEKEKLIECL